MLGAQLVLGIIRRSYKMIHVKYFGAKDYMCYILVLSLVLVNNIMRNDLTADPEIMITFFFPGKFIDVLFHSSKNSWVALLFSILLYTYHLKQYLSF